jgi:mono/diheme cytochrome c family protein
LKFKAIYLIFGIFLVLFACDEHPYKQGKILYTNFCANCHGDQGEGLKALIPPLAPSDYLEQHRSELPCIIRQGMRHEIVVNGKQYQQEMPAIPKLSFFEITNVLNYIQFGLNQSKTGKVFTADEVETNLKNCP